MARTSVQDQTLVVEFSVWERIFTQRKQVTVPLTQVLRARPEQHPLAAVCGARVVGAEILGVGKVGYWVTPAATRRLVCVRRGQTAIRVMVTSGFDPRFDEIIVSASAAVVAALAEVRS